MNMRARKIGLGCLVASAMLVGLLSVQGISLGQSLKEQIVGTWQITSIYNEEKEAKTYNFGDKPVGLLMFDRSGNVMQFLAKPGAPKFAENNRLKGTDAENRAAIQSLIAGFGSYTVDGDTGHDFMARQQLSQSRWSAREAYLQNYWRQHGCDQSNGLLWGNFIRQLHSRQITLPKSA